MRLRPWILDPRSLSRRIARACPDGFGVRLIAQRWERPRPHECRALALARRERALVREVLLTCHGVPWVFARSVFPRRVLRGPQRRILRLGNRPLGEVLFTVPGLRRERIAIAPAARDPRALERCARALGARPTAAWRRSSVFRIRAGALLVSEIFLEDCGSA